MEQCTQKSSPQRVVTVVTLLGSLLFDEDFNSGREDLVDAVAVVLSLVVLRQMSTLDRLDGSGLDCSPPRPSICNVSKGRKAGPSMPMAIATEVQQGLIWIGG